MNYKKENTKRITKNPEERRNKVLALVAADSAIGYI